ncbi:hypothetical protein MKX01_042429 [Papaver californicum]|nr:hypothetical protein MKX01_042429 [Papaver californicum]
MDGELDFSNQVLKMTMESFLEDFLGDSHAAAGTQTNTSSPTAAQDVPQSQSYFHHRTKNHPVEEKTTTEETYDSIDIKSKKRAPGNRESVRKYRERKKARQALIEDELNKLRIVNQQLLKRLQGQVALEQEVARFKLLLVDIRGRIKGELGSFPYQKPNKGICSGISRNMSTLSRACDVNQCDLQYPGFDNQDGDVSGGFQNEGFDGSYLPCVWNNNNNNLGYAEFLDFGQTNNVRSTANVNLLSTASKKRKGKISTKSLKR